MSGQQTVGVGTVGFVVQQRLDIDAAGAHPLPSPGLPLPAGNATLLAEVPVIECEGFDGCYKLSMAKLALESAVRDR